MFFYLQQRKQFQPMYSQMDRSTYVLANGLVCVVFKENMSNKKLS